MDENNGKAPASSSSEPTSDSTVSWSSQGSASLSRNTDEAPPKAEGSDSLSASLESAESTAEPNGEPRLQVEPNQVVAPGIEADLGQGSTFISQPGSRDHGLSEQAASSTDSFDAEGSTQAPRVSSSDKRELEEDEEGPTVISRSQEQAPAVPDDSSADSFAKRLVGTALDHYRLEEFIGGGGMGAVFRAYDALLRRTVAVKILSRGSTDQDLLRRFVNEAQSAAKLDHENIARVFFVGRDQGLNYIVFEFVEGKNLRQLVTEQGVLPIGLALRYMCQMARALEHAAARQVIHRDIKPSNVVITPDHRVKLVDMGLARIHHLDSQQADLTASDMTLGTFDYISPEQARDPRGADTRSDLYSLGCTFYFTLTGVPPFPDGTALQKVLAHGEADRPDPRELRADVPASIARIITRLMASDPDARFQTPNELLAELLVAATELNIDVGLNESYIIETSVDRRDWLDRLVPWLLSGGALALVIGMIEFAMPPAMAINEGVPQYRVANVDSMTSNPIVPNGPGANRSPSSIPGTLDGAPTNAITQIRVGNATAAPGTLVVETWAEALAQIEKNPQITDMQLWFDGTIDVEPFSIKSPVLHISAADGHRPGVRFKTANDNTTSAPLVRLFGGDFEWQGIDIDWQIEPGTEVTPGSLFRIEQNYAQTFPDLSQKSLGESPYQEFNFVDSRVTLGNLSTESTVPGGGVTPSTVTPPAASSTANNSSQIPVPVTPSVSTPESGPALIEVVRPETFLLTLADGEIAHFPRILVRGVMLRGQSRVLKAVPGTPFQLQCEQSLIVSPLAAVRLGGIRSDAIIPGEKLKAEVDLRQVTVIGGGLIDVQPGDASPVVMPLDLRTVDCWLVTDPEKPLARYRLTNATSDDRLRWTGSDNSISGGSLLWSKTTAGGTTRTLTLNDSYDSSPLQGLAPLDSITPLPARIASVLRAELPRERFEIADLEAIIAQIPMGTNRRLGVAPRDLPPPVPAPTSSTDSR